jgi:hypothetical protein
MVKSKINGLSSWMFHIILSRTAERLDLADAVDDFHRSYLLMREMGIPITEQVVSVPFAILHSLLLADVSLPRRFRISAFIFDCSMTM